MPLTAKRLLSKTILAKIYANDKCARAYYSPLPVIPHGPSEFSEWAKTHRPNLPEYVKGLIHYEYAVEKDAQKISDFILENIIPSSPLFECLGSNPKELLELYEPIIERTLKDHCSLLGFKGDELIAVSLNSIKTMPPSSDEAPTNVDILEAKDYGPMIDSANFKTRAAKKVHVFVELLHSKVEKLLPNSKKLMFIEIGGVSKSYRGRGISQEMVKHTMRLAHDQFHCDNVVTIADSKAAQKMFEQKLGYKLLRELKLDYFLDGNVPVFNCDEIASGKLLSKKI
ncbi:N-acetyltransferase domain-containing protein [Aphelenchoides bicaudatus]|nr:N-acetyltransferase domain-containing protein [Aphelenchoides bicaudatus]